MVSATQQSSRIRKRKSTTNGKDNKRARRAHGTPAFAVHPEGYDAKAADAKKPEVKAEAKPKKAAAPKKAAKPAAAPKKA
jgi:hypothetical protein